MKRSLVLMFRFEAADAKFLRQSPPGAREELISTGRSAGVSLDDNPFRMAGQILKLPAAIKSAVALILSISPGALGVPDGVQQSATFRSEPVGALLLNIGKKSALQFGTVPRAKAYGGGNWRCPDTQHDPA